MSVVWMALTAVPVGLAFGAILERVGLGDARVIRAQFTGNDFTVVLVMFGAIVTAMLGVLWLEAAGIVDAATLSMPPTDVGGQVLGGVLFGCGFGIAALCPGTACVAAASGKRGGLATMCGMLIGTLLTVALWPLVGEVTAVIPDERRTLATDLGVPVWTIAISIALLAVAARYLSHHVSKAQAAGDTWRINSFEVATVTLALAYAGVEGRATVPIAQLSSLGDVITREEDHVDAIELAEWIRAGRRGLLVVDVREELDSSTYTIPGARAVQMNKLANLEADPTSLIVTYSDGGAHGAQAWVLLKLRGFRNVLVLRDGMAAWEDDVLSPVLPSESNGDSPETARVRELSVWFGGQPRATPREGAGQRGAAPRPRRRNRC